MPVFFIVRSVGRNGTAATAPNHPVEFCGPIQNL
jgi:hypothetical protein